MRFVEFERFVRAFYKSFCLFIAGIVVACCIAIFVHRYEFPLSKAEEFIL